MNVTIRKARESDRKQVDWQYQHTPDGRFAPWVVTVEGVVYVVIEIHSAWVDDRRIETEHVVWQNGSAAVPELVRMAKRYFSALPTLYGDRSDRRERATEARLRDTMAWMRSHP